MWRNQILLAAAVSLGVLGVAQATSALTMHVDQTASYQYCKANAGSQGCTVPANWFTYSFDDSGWSTGAGPFSSQAPSSTIFDTANAGAPWAPDPAPAIPSTFTQWDVNADPYLLAGTGHARTVWVRSHRAGLVEEQAFSPPSARLNRRFAAYS
jgi:hypothetical protein